MSQSPRPFLQRLRHTRFAESLAVVLGLAAIRVLSALPERWVLSAADGLGTVLAYLNRRGRRIALQNLKAVFGDAMAPAERRRVVRASYRNTVRSIFLMMTLQPMTRARYSRWVDVEPGLERQARFRRLLTRGGVLASGHVGNWELLLALRVFYPDLPPAAFLAEAVPHEVVNRILIELRRHGDLVAAPRRGGARRLIRVVERGGIAALLVDRNVRRIYGGIYAPFLGLEARTTPLAARIAMRHDVPVHPIFCLPNGDGRYRLEVEDDVAAGTEHLDDGARELEITRRLNTVLEQRIRAEPEHWQWSQKRFKSRPHEEPGPYPPYSEYDPDPE
jgi:KDO2-lipid IV(A) lauroyltransferase